MDSVETLARQRADLLMLMERFTDDIPSNLDSISDADIQKKIISQVFPNLITDGINEYELNGILKVVDEVIKREDKNAIKGYPCGNSCIRSEHRCLNKGNPETLPINFHQWAGNHMASGGKLSPHQQAKARIRSNPPGKSIFRATPPEDK